MPGVVASAGDYTVELDTGFLQDAFLLDDATAGVLNNTEYVLDGTTQFADVTDGTLNVNIKRGRRDQGAINAHAGGALENPGQRIGAAAER